MQIATSLGHVVYKTSPPFPRRRLAETLDTARAVRRRAARLLGLSPSRIQVTHREPNPLFLILLCSSGPVAVAVDAGPGAQCVFCGCRYVV